MVYSLEDHYKLPAVLDGNFYLGGVLMEKRTMPSLENGLSDVNFTFTQTLTSR